MSYLETIEAAAMRSKITIFLDENRLELKEGLKDAGFKVIVLKQGLSDEEIGELAEGHAILTANTADFIDNAKASDYDIISIDDLKFHDTDKTRKNKTVQKVVKAIRDTKFYTLRGNFLLKIYNDGHKLEQIMI